MKAEHVRQNQIAALHKKLDAALKQFAADNNLVPGAARIKYGATDFKVEVSFSDKEANPNEVDPRFMRDLERNGFFLGLDKSMIGKEVVMSSSRGMAKYTFQGMRASKVVMKAEADGKNYLFNAESAAHYLKA